MLKSREQSAPLQLGCTFFGVFTTTILVITLFMFLGRRYIGGWAFYVAIAGVVLLGLVRMRRNTVAPAQRQEIRRNRILMQDRLAQLKVERQRLQILSDGSYSDGTNDPVG